MTVHLHLSLSFINCAALNHLATPKVVTAKLTSTVAPSTLIVLLLMQLPASTIVAKSIQQYPKSACYNRGNIKYHSTPCKTKSQGAHMKSAYVCTHLCMWCSTCGITLCKCPLLQLICSAIGCLRTMCPSVVYCHNVMHNCCLNLHQVLTFVVITAKKCPSSSCEVLNRPTTDNAIFLS